MLAQPWARIGRKNTYGCTPIVKIAGWLPIGQQRRSTLLPYITCDRAATTAVMFRLLMAATQMRPESKP